MPLPTPPSKLGNLLPPDECYGFRHVGTRRNYYPAGGSAREDAVVMSLPL